MEEEEILLKDVRCDKCKSYYTAKPDDGRIRWCMNEEAKQFIKEIKDDFGCIFFEPEI